MRQGSDERFPSIACYALLSSFKFQPTWREAMASHHFRILAVDDEKAIMHLYKQILSR